MDDCRTWRDFTSWKEFLDVLNRGEVTFPVAISVAGRRDDTHYAKDESEARFWVNQSLARSTSFRVRQTNHIYS